MNWHYVPYKELSPLQQVLADTFRKTLIYYHGYAAEPADVPKAVEVVVTYSDAAFALLGETLLEISGSRIANIPVRLTDTLPTGCPTIPMFHKLPSLAMTLLCEDGCYRPMPPILVTETPLRRIATEAAQ